jgi:hypothetical protein
MLDVVYYYIYYLSEGNGVYVLLRRTHIFSVQASSKSNYKLVTRYTLCQFMLLGQAFLLVLVIL